MKILLTGGTGFIGKAVAKNLSSRGHELVVLTRDPESAQKKIGVVCKVYRWDALKGPAPQEAFSGVDVVINFAGEPIATGRWTPATKTKIYNSRILGTRNLVESINQLVKPVKLISTSAVGFYGNRGEETLTEESSIGEGFLAEVCGAWEAEASKAKTTGTVIFRLGVVLGNGGALDKMLPIFRKGLGGPLGNGNQWMSWIHIHDLVQAITQAAEDPAMNATYNAVSPNPVTNEIFTYLLGQALHKPTLFRVPKFVLKLALGEMAEETLLASAQAVPENLLERGFQFEFPELDGALKDIFNHATRMAQ